MFLLDDKLHVTLVCMSFRKLPGLKNYEHIIIALLNHKNAPILLEGVSIAVDWQRVQNQMHCRPKITPFFRGLVLVWHRIFLAIIIIYLLEVTVILLTIWPQSGILHTLDIH